MLGVSFDESRWPILVVTFEGNHSDQTTERFMRAMEGYYGRRQPFIMIVVIESYGREDRHLIAPVARWYREHTEAFEEFGLGLALVPPSETFRFLLSTFMAIAPIPDHYTVVKTREEALAWAQERLERKAEPAPA